MIGKMIQFLREVKLELKRVTWPTKAEVISSTAVVLVTTAIITIFLYLCDLGLARLISTLIK
ncbi:MAG: preprotein translocase subunit SecE [bacterium]|nr:preprotein translocase subunit SecE [bacterium]